MLTEPGRVHVYVCMHVRTNLEAKGGQPIIILFPFFLYFISSAALPETTLVTRKLLLVEAEGRPPSIHALCTDDRRHVTHIQLPVHHFYFMLSMMFTHGQLYQAV